MEDYVPDLAFLSQYPAQARAEISALIHSHFLVVAGSWRSAWQNLAAFCIKLEEGHIRHGLPENMFDGCIKHLNPAGPGELKEMMKAKKYLEDPRYAEILKGKYSPKQICGVIDAYRAEQAKLDLDGVTPYQIQTEVNNLSFATLATTDVLSVTPNLAGITGEDSVKSILDALGLPYREQITKAYSCDFGELKTPDFLVGTVKARGDARLTKGFYIENTWRLTVKNKDLGLFYLLHQIVQHSDLPTIVIYDAPATSDRVWEWAQKFQAKHESSNKLFAVCTFQQFREWALRKLGRQA